MFLEMGHGVQSNGKTKLKSSTEKLDFNLVLVVVLEGLLEGIQYKRTKYKLERVLIKKK